MSARAIEDFSCPLPGFRVEFAAPSLVDKVRLTSWPRWATVLIFRTLVGEHVYSRPRSSRFGVCYFRMSMKKLALMIDGGFLRVAAKNAKIHYNPDFIEAFAKICAGVDEELFRSLYYDCAPYQGHQKLPVSGSTQTFADSDQWLKDLAKKDLMAVRLGVLKFRGYKLKRTPVMGVATLTDADFRPDFEQKGVDMRIGLDIASYSALKCAERIGLVTADTDCVPAMKLARKSGVQVVLITLPGGTAPSELAQHADYVRAVAWPP